jgi:hypothetical protein
MVVVNGDSSDLFDGIVRYHIIILSWKLLISLSRPVSIAEDPVETVTCTIFSAFLKPYEVDSFSHVFL